jgi:hypothetical protein
MQPKRNTPTIIQNRYRQIGSCFFILSMKNFIFSSYYLCCWRVTFSNHIRRIGLSFQTNIHKGRQIEFFISFISSQDDLQPMKKGIENKHFVHILAESSFIHKQHFISLIIHGLNICQIIKYCWFEVMSLTIAIPYNHIISP